MGRERYLGPVLGVLLFGGEVGASCKPQRAPEATPTLVVLRAESPLRGAEPAPYVDRRLVGEIIGLEAGYTGDGLHAPEELVNSVTFLSGEEFGKLDPDAAAITETDVSGKRVFVNLGSSAFRKENIDGAVKRRLP